MSTKYFSVSTIVFIVNKSHDAMLLVSLARKLRIGAKMNTCFNDGGARLGEFLSITH